MLSSNYFFHSQFFCCLFWIYVFHVSWGCLFVWLLLTYQLIFSYSFRVKSEDQESGMVSSAVMCIHLFPTSLTNENSCWRFWARCGMTGQTV